MIVIQIVVYRSVPIDAHASKLPCHCEEARRADVAISWYNV